MVSRCSPCPTRKNYENAHNIPKYSRIQELQELQELQKLPLDPKCFHIAQSSEHDDNPESFLYKREVKRKNGDSNLRNYNYNNNYANPFYKNQVSKRACHCKKPPSYVKLRELLKKAKQELIKDHLKCKASKNQEVRREYFKYLNECYQSSFRRNEEDFSENENAGDIRHENINNRKRNAINCINCKNCVNCINCKNCLEEGKENSFKNHSKQYNSIRLGNESPCNNSRKGKSLNLNTEKCHDKNKNKNKTTPYKPNPIKRKYKKESPEIITNTNINNKSELKYNDEIKRNSHQLRFMREEQHKSLKKFRFLEAKCRELERNLFHLEEFKPPRIVARNSRNQNEYRSLGYNNNNNQLNHNNPLLSNNKNFNNHNNNNNDNNDNNNNNEDAFTFSENENSEKDSKININNNIKENNPNNLNFLINSKLLKRPSEFANMNNRKGLKGHHQNEQNEQAFNFNFNNFNKASELENKNKNPKRQGQNVIVLKEPEPLQKLQKLQNINVNPVSERIKINFDRFDKINQLTESHNNEKNISYLRKNELEQDSLKTIECNDELNRYCNQYQSQDSNTDCNFNFNQTRLSQNSGHQDSFTNKDRTENNPRIHRYLPKRGTEINQYQKKIRDLENLENLYNSENFDNLDNLGILEADKNKNNKLGSKFYPTSVIGNYELNPDEKAFNENFPSSYRNSHTIDR